MNRMSECEEIVMIAVWSCEEAPNISEIVEKVNQRFEKKWAIQTVSTFLKRLVDKKYLTTEKKGRYIWYSPAITLQEYRKAKINEVTELLYKNDRQRAYEDLNAGTVLARGVCM